MHVSVPQCITKSTQMGVKAWLLVHLQSWDSYFGSSLETQWNERPQLPGSRMRMASNQLQWSQPLNVHHIQRVEKKNKLWIFERHWASVRQNNTADPKKNTPTRWGDRGFSDTFSCSCWDDGGKLKCVWDKERGMTYTSQRRGRGRRQEDTCWKVGKLSVINCRMGGGQVGEMGREMRWGGGGGCAAVNDFLFHFCWVSQNMAALTLCL